MMSIRTTFSMKTVMKEKKVTGKNNEDNEDSGKDKDKG